MCFRVDEEHGAITLFYLVSFLTNISSPNETNEDLNPAYDNNIFKAANSHMSEQI